MAEQSETTPTEPTPGRIFSRYNILSMYLPAAAMSMGRGIVIPVLPVYARSFGVSLEDALLIVILHSLGALASTIPTGYLVDKIGRRPIVLGGPLLAAVAALLTATAGSFPELLAYRFMAGWASQMWMQSRLAIIADTSAQSQRGRQITSMMSVSGAGRLLSPALGGTLALWDIRAPFVFEGILILLVIYPSFRLIKETNPAKLAAQEGGEVATGSFRDLLIYPVIVLWMTQALASMTRGSLWGGTLNVYVAYAYDLSALRLGFLASIAGAIGIPITFSAGHIMDRFGRKASLVPGFSLMCVWLVLMSLTAEFQTPFWTFVATFFGVHAAVSLTSGNMMTLGSDMAPAHARGRFFGAWRFIGDIGLVLSPLAFRQLASSVGFTASFLFLSATAAGAALMLATQVRETLRRETARPARTETR